MKLVLDTNAYCYCDAGLELALHHAERAEALFLPAVVYGELCTMGFVMALASRRTWNA